MNGKLYSVKRRDMYKIELKKRKVSELQKNPNNPRIIKDANYKKLKKSIEMDGEFMVARPVVVSMHPNRINQVIGGNQRLQVVKDLGWAEVPVAEVYDASEEEEQRLAFKDNLHAGEHDWEALANGFELDFLKDVGFEEKDLSRITRRKNSLKDDEFDTEKEAAAIDNPVTKLGDVWQLGRHRLMCGDSTKKEDVDALMGGQLADMVFTDPPYNVNYSGRGKTTSRTIENDNMDSESFRRFLDEVFARYKESTKETAPMYVCYASRTHREFEDAINKNQWGVIAQIIWVKMVASMGWGDYRWKHEPILYCKKQNASVEFYGDRTEYTEWKEERSDEEKLRILNSMIEKEEKGGSTVWRLHRDKNYIHPTQKPVQLIEIALANSTQAGDLVLDLFGGSGSTLIACESTGRICHSMEIDPKFVDAVIKRWEEKTGKKAEKISVN